MNKMQSVLVSLTPAQWQIVSNCLTMGPWGQVDPIIRAMHQQLMAAQQESQKSAEPPATE